MRLRRAVQIASELIRTMGHIGTATGDGIHEAADERLIVRGLLWIQWFAGSSKFAVGLLLSLRDEGMSSGNRDPYMLVEIDGLLELGA